MKNKQFIEQLKKIDKLLEYIIENDWIEYEVNQREFSELLNSISPYKVKEIIDYLDALVRLEEK